MRDNYNNVKQ